MKGFYNYLSGITGIDEVYIYIILNTLLVICIFLIIKRIVKGIIEREVPLTKQYSVNNAIQIVISIIEIIILFFVWDNYIKSVITLVSILGASFIVALRECVLSFFGGIYIRVKRLFVVGDRIEVDGIKGDVVSISTFDFDVLEISKAAFSTISICFMFFIDLDRLSINMIIFHLLNYGTAYCKSISFSLKFIFLLFFRPCYFARHALCHFIICLYNISTHQFNQFNK